MNHDLDWDTLVDIIEELPEVRVELGITIKGMEHLPKRKVIARAPHTWISNGATLASTTASGPDVDYAIRKLYTNLLQLKKDEVIAVDPPGKERTHWLPSDHHFGWRILTQDETEERWNR